MAKPLQLILNWIAKNFKDDPSRMLVCTGITGWAVSSLAQICGILFNSKISKEQKGFLVPQECADAVVNIGSFFLITQVAKKGVSNLFKTGKFAPKSVKEFLNKNKDLYSKKIGKVDFNLGEVLEKNAKELLSEYDACKNFGTTLATVCGGIIATNIVTPIIRNNMASGMQKKYIARKQATGEFPIEENKQSIFKSTVGYSYNSIGLKI